MSDTDGTTSFTAGNWTLSGWDTDYMGSPGTSVNLFVTPINTNSSAIPSFDFNWTAPTLNANNDGGEPAQVITATDGSSGTDGVSLEIQINQGAGNDAGVTIFSGGTALLNGGTAGGSYTINDAPGAGAQSLLDSQIQSLQVADSTSEKDSFSITFTLTDTGSGGGPVGSPTTFTENFQTACYAPGTRIATPTGEVAVEDLQIGDLVATTSGVAKPVKWIGRRSYSVAAVAGHSNLRPVLIRKDALGAGLPQRDLVVSPMHALLVDEALVPAAALVNELSIVRLASTGAVEYIHVELDQHEMIFAEGQPAETFVDDNSRAMFENVSEYYDLYGFAESSLGFSVPRLEEGYQLEAIRRRIAGQAPRMSAPGVIAGHVEQLADGMLEGWVMDRANPTAPVELEVLVDGETVATVLANRYRPDLDRADIAGGRCGFSVAMPASAEHLAQVEVRRASDGGQVAMPQRALVTA